MIAVSDVSFAYRDRSALDKVSFRAEAGELFGLLGPNGSGKSTLFRLMATLLPIQSGSIRVGDHDVAKASAAVRRMTGVVFQAPALDTRLTVRENLYFHGRIFGVPMALLKRQVEEGIHRLGLKPDFDRRVEELSGGMRRRADLARGLIHQPSVLLLDEPTTGLDPRARSDFWDAVESYRRHSGCTVVVSTHLMDEAELCDSVVLLANGTVVGSGSPQDLKSGIAGETLSVVGDGSAEFDVTADRIVGQPGTSVAGRRLYRIEGAASLVPELSHEFGASLRSVEIAQATLEDVFLRLTGSTLDGSHQPTREEESGPK